MNFFETHCQKDHGEHTKSKPTKLLTVHGHLGYGDLADRGKLVKE